MTHFPNCRRALALACLALATGCTSSLDRVETLDDVALADGVEMAELGGSPEAAQEPVFRRGVFGDLLGRPAAQASADAPDTLEAAVEAAVGGAAGSGAGSPDVDTTPQGAESADAPVRRGGLFGGLFRGAAPVPSPPPASEGATELASLDPAPADPPRRGLFGALRAASRDAATEPDVPAGAALGFGQVGRVCGLSRRALGREVERFPEGSRRGGYALYDSAPGSTAPRAFYVTGFSDGCARMITAANAVFGAPSMHEALRYGLPADTVPSSRTDEAYKTLKARICRVGRNAPCGARIDRLEANTVFVTVYGSFTNNTQWSNLLLHDGAVLATDIKQGG